MDRLLLAAIDAPEGWRAAPDPPEGVLADDRHALLLRHANGAEILLDRRGPAIALHLPQSRPWQADWEGAAIADPEPMATAPSWRGGGTIDADATLLDPADAPALLHAQIGTPARQALRAIQHLLAEREPDARLWVRSEHREFLQGADPGTLVAHLLAKDAIGPLLDAAGWRVLAPGGGLVRPQRLRLRAAETAHARAAHLAVAADVARRHRAALPSWWP